MFTFYQIFIMYFCFSKDFVGGDCFRGGFFQQPPWF